MEMHAWLVRVWKEAVAVDAGCAWPGSGIGCGACTNSRHAKNSISNAKNLLLPHDERLQARRAHAQLWWSMRDTYENAWEDILRGSCASGMNSLNAHEFHNSGKAFSVRLLHSRLTW